LSGRLADPAFRKGVEANIAAYPEFDRILHPEKYPAPQTGATTVPGAPPAPPAQATPQKPGQRSARASIITAASASAPRS
jgi:hypothetical protein